MTALPGQEPVRDRRYTTVLFDLFDTLVRLDRNRLPALVLGGREVRTSAARLHAIGASVLGGVTLEALHEALLWSYQEAERRREGTHREVTAEERFGLLYGRLGVDPAAVPAAVTARLLAAHGACLARAAAPMPGQAGLLAWLRGRYRLGVVSNFDYSPTVHRILGEAGLLGRFEAVVVSDAVGWRKPRAAIFEAAFARMGVGPRECLFVGDRPEIDVLGARGVGMDAAWLNAGRLPLPDGLPPPDFDLGSLGELRAVLEAREKDLDAPVPLR